MNMTVYTYKNVDTPVWKLLSACEVEFIQMILYDLALGHYLKCRMQKMC